MSRWYVYAFVAILIFAVRGDALGNTFTWASAYTDPVTGLEWVSPSVFVGAGSGLTGQNYLNMVFNSNATLATSQQLTQLFSDIGPFSPKFSVAFGTSFAGNEVFSGGYYDAGNGELGVAVGEFFNSAPNPILSPWQLNPGPIPVSSLDPGNLVGFWTVLNPVPEPCTMLLLGSGLVGLLAYRKRFMKV